MDEATTDDDEALPAGDFSSWLAQVRAAVAGAGESDVPCGTCTACCTSSQFVHVEPDEVAALARIPAELLFPAPGLPEGHVLLGYDQRGRCPMLGEAGCTIYDDRPRTCRTYDCRVFPAADVDVAAEKPAIAERARRWRFAHPTAQDRLEHEAVRSAATFLAAADGLPPELATSTATHRAVLAVEAHTAFLGTDAVTGAPAPVEPSPDEVLVAVRARRSRPST